MNVEVNYNDEVERKNTHPKLLPEVIGLMTTQSVDLLAKSGVTSASHKKGKGNPTVVLKTNRVTFKEQSQVHRRSVLSDVQITKFKERIDISWKIRSAEHNKRITKLLRSVGHSCDKLLKQ